MTCATKNLILHLEHEDPEPIVLNTSTDDLPNTPNTSSYHGHSGPRHSLAVPRSESRARTPARKSMGMMPISPAPSRMSSVFTPARTGTSMGGSLPNTPNARERKPVKPPVLLSVVETPDVAVGAVDPRKRRVATSTRFSSRAGADRRIFVSTYNLPMSRAKGEDGETEGEAVREGPVVDFDTDIAPLTGAWSALADDSEDGWPVHLGVPSGFKGLATPEKNPMAMALSHEEVVVGTADGTIYVMSFVGYQYRATVEKEVIEVLEEEEEDME
ncbi:hypothetical protein FRC07_007832 [Ceratobasidium sp. 392]|nr:hypothetical protein FRC07_007832 [Ceratobasidium sp. 392]